MIAPIVPVSRPRAVRAEPIHAGLGVPPWLAAPVPYAEAVLGAWLLVQWQRSDERAARLGPWVDHYNYRRLHAGLGEPPPLSRIANAW